MSLGGSCVHWSLSLAPKSLGPACLPSDIAISSELAFLRYF